MTQKVLPNKNKVTIYKNDEILGGIYSFNISENKNIKYAYEILNADPWATVGQKSDCIVTIKQYAVDSSDYKDNFSLTFKSNDSGVKYNLCSVKSSETSVNENGKLIKTFVISASGKEEL